MTDHPTLAAQIEAVELAAVRAGDTVSLLAEISGEKSAPRALRGAELFRTRLEAAAETLRTLEYGSAIAR